MAQTLDRSNCGIASRPRLRRRWRWVVAVVVKLVYRLMQRGLLRSSLALRRKVISKAEIERFLKETSRADY